MKRGAIAAFRRYLNALCAGQPHHVERQFQQRSRGYGDYLYHQDRPRFDEHLNRALEGDPEFPGFDGARWK